ncbi:MAG TPA: hypothetical protein VGJ37_11300 [Pyrinomonadaceae bacterium]|jgi:hypothetical protein
MLSASTVSINKVRVSGHHGDPLSLRLRLDRVLSSVDLAPRGLPATAIVCFKRLRDPRPGLLDLSSSSLRSSFAWEQALKEHVAGLIAKAPRSAGERNAAVNPDCVIFFDQADLLASLASDWCRGEIESRWWWRTLLQSSIIGRELLAMWRDAAEHVPAALERLGAQKIEFVRRLSDAEADELLAVVVRRFALDAIAPVLESSTAVLESSFVREQHVAQESVVDQSSGSQSAPWQKFVSEIRNEQLSVARERFLGVSVMVLRAPAVVRTRKFATAIAVWQREATGFVELPVRVEVEREKTSRQSPITTNRSLKFKAQQNPVLVTAPAEEKAPAQDLVQQSPVTDPFRLAITEPEDLSVQSVSLQPHDNDVPDSSSVITEPSVGRLAPVESVTLRAESSIEEAVGHESKPDVFYENKLIPVQEAALDETVTTQERGKFESSVSEPVRDTGVFDSFVEVETDFAGAFYLVNLGIYLGLYGDFTTPAEPGIELHIWDFVAFVGRELAGDQIENDPVWPLLADLAGRQDELEELPAWLADLMPTVRARLRLGLGLDETTDPGPLLMAHTGRVRVTATQIDVFLLLAELPIAIRFAGLDRDPGWVPAAGRFIAFHFQ